MNFELTKEQQLIISSVVSFLKERGGVEEFRSLRGTERGWSEQAWREMGDYGWLGINMPELLGGIGGTFVDVALILEQLGRGLAPEPFLASVVLAGDLVRRLGSLEQQQTLLTPMIAGETSLALAFAERQSRYNLADCLTRAEQDGTGWSITGQKSWVLNGHAANSLVVIARTRGDQLDETGLTAFVVAAETKGLSRVSSVGMDGQRTARLDFDGVSVGPEACLGPIGEALPALQWVVDRATAATCAEGQGLIREMLDRTVEYLKQREQFSQKIGSFQALQHRAVEMLAETELCRGTMILAAIRADEEPSGDRTADISAAKVQLTRGGWFVQENAIQLHGGIGITDENDIGLFFKRLRVLQALFGDADTHIERFATLSRFNQVA